MKLSKRLAAIAGHIDKGACVADIGTDHGYLPVYLARSGLAGRVIASDISEASLSSARRSAVRYGVEGSITFITAPGLSGICEMEIDTVVIAGMGGETIIGILAGAPWLKNREVKLVLQPQTKIYELSRWLIQNGYAIQDAQLVQEKGKNYTIIIGRNAVPPLFPH